MMSKTTSLMALRFKGEKVLLTIEVEVGEEEVIITTGRIEPWVSTSLDCLVSKCSWDVHAYTRCIKRNEFMVRYTMFESFIQLYSRAAVCMAWTVVNIFVAFYIRDTLSWCLFSMVLRSSLNKKTRDRVEAIDMNEWNLCTSFL